MAIDRNTLERTVSVRLPLDLLHRIESRLERSLKAKREAEDNFREWHGPKNISDAIRKLVATGLKVHERDSDFMEAALQEYLPDRLAAMLALGVQDKSAWKMLEQIAKHEPAKDPWDD
jgi:hypothetical protein